MLSNAIDKVSKITSLDKKLIGKVYSNYWLFIKTMIKEMPLKEGLSEEEFRKIKTSFNIPSIGKLGVNYKKYQKKIKLNKDLRRKYGVNT